MNELLEHMRALDTRTSLLHADMNKAKDALMRLLPEDATGEVLPGATAGVGVSAADESREMASGFPETPPLQDCSLVSLFVVGKRVLSESPSERASPGTPPKPTCPRHCSRRFGRPDARLPDRTCNVKLVLLEEAATLCVYAAADQCVDAFNPWSLRSVTCTRPRRLFPPKRPKLITPTWLVSRQSRVSLLDQGFQRFQSRPLGEILRSSCFFGSDEEVVVLTVKLVRKFDTL
ncbi:hypothetical protein MRX96_014487 [Rhipicephalus microplus]